MGGYGVTYFRVQLVSLRLIFRRTIWQGAFFIILYTHLKRCVLAIISCVMGLVLSCLTVDSIAQVLLPLLHH